MKVSVIIPSTDSKKALNTLQSLQRQDEVKADEIIIAGRNLNDLASASGKEVKVINENRWLNAASARNLGAESAKAEVLLFIDDDCLASPNWIKANLRALSEDKNTGVVLGRIAGASGRYFARCADLSGFWIQQNLAKQEVRSGYAATLGIRRELFFRIGGFNSRMDMVEDCDLCVKVNKAGYKVIYDPDILVYHHHRRDSLSKLISFMYEGGINYRRYFTAEEFNPSLIKALALTLKGAFRNTADSLRMNKEVCLRRWLYVPGVFAGFLAWHFGLNRRISPQKSLESLIFFITDKCNLNCQHCFYWRRLNQQGDISFEQLEKAFQSFGKIKNLLLSGGEPFLREDLVGICLFFTNHNKIEHLSIPTNGSIPELIEVKAEEILSKLNLKLTIGLSLDGMEEYHDRLRGTNGSFKKAVETYGKLSLLKERYPQLAITVNPVVTIHNTDEIIRLAEFVKENMPAIDYFWLCIVRGEPRSKDQIVPSSDILRRLNSKVNQIFYQGKSYLSSQIKTWDLLYELKIKTLEEKKQLLPCQAGRMIGVLEANGDVRACELREPFGNIKEQDFLNIWNSHLADLMRKSIKNKECYCTHECFIYPSFMKKCK